MSRIAEEKISEIRDRVDIVELIGRYLSLKQSGDNHKGLCPFHSEKTPSFNVNASRQIFHCFGCGEGGNAISFLMKVEGLSFPEAAKRLAAEVGVEIEEEQLSPAEQEQRRQREKLQRINETACAYFQEQLLRQPDGEPGRAYLKKRGYDRSCAEKFRLGYAPERWEGLSGYLQQQELALEPARQLGLIRPGKQGRGDYDLFRGRLMFPILDSYGQVVAFGGRVLDDSLPKYINSPESPLYQKSRVLYGLYQAKEPMRRSGEAIIVEGYFDLIALHNAGIEQAVATCGTALTREHARLLKRYAKRVILLFDQDAAGQAAAVKALDGLLPEGLEVQLVEMPPGDDPDSLLQSEGADGLRRRLTGGRPLLDLLAERRLAETEQDVNARARVIDELLRLIRLLPNRIEQELHLKGLGQRTGLAPELLARQSTGGGRQRPERSRRETAAPGAGKPRSHSKADKAEELLLQLLVWEPQHKNEIVEAGGAELFRDLDRQTLATELLALPEAGDATVLLDGERLEAPQKAILSGILMKGKQAVESDPDKILHDSRDTLSQKEKWRQRSRELTRLIDDALSQGDQELFESLAREMLDINNRLSQSGDT